MCIQFILVNPLSSNRYVIQIKSFEKLNLMSKMDFDHLDWYCKIFRYSNKCKIAKWYLFLPNPEFDLSVSAFNKMDYLLQIKSVENLNWYQRCISIH